MSRTRINPQDIRPMVATIGLSETANVIRVWADQAILTYVGPDDAPDMSPVGRRIAEHRLSRLATYCRETLRSIAVAYFGRNGYVESEPTSDPTIREIGIQAIEHAVSVINHAYEIVIAECDEIESLAASAVTARDGMRNASIVARNDLRIMAYGMISAARMRSVWDSFLESWQDKIGDRFAGQGIFPDEWDCDPETMPVAVLRTASGAFTVAAADGAAPAWVADAGCHLDWLSPVMPEPMVSTNAVAGEITGSVTVEQIRAWNRAARNARNVAVRIWEDLAADMPQIADNHSWCAEYEYAAEILAPKLSFAPPPPVRTREYRIVRTYYVNARSADDAVDAIDDCHYDDEYIELVD